MTPEQIRLVRDSFRELIPERDDVAAVFYNRLFAVDPTIKPLFAGVDLEAQGRKLIGALALVINTIEAPQRLVGPLRALGQRHERYGVEPRHYASVGRALIATLELYFRDRFTASARNAWLAALALVSTAMMAAETEVETRDAA